MESFGTQNSTVTAHLSSLYNKPTTLQDGWTQDDPLETRHLGYPDPYHWMLMNTTGLNSTGNSYSPFTDLESHDLAPVGWRFIGDESSEVIFKLDAGFADTVKFGEIESPSQRPSLFIVAPSQTHFQQP